MNRRGFLGSILALGAAPAIVRADSLMRIVPVDTDVLQFKQYEWTTDYLDISIDNVLTDAPYRQVIKPVDGEDLSAMMARVFRERRPEIIRNIAQRNALLRQMARTGRTIKA